MTTALIIFSGGIDSTVMLAKALDEGKQCVTLSFDYGQRHRLELRAAKNISRFYKVPHKVLKIDGSTFENSCLVSAGQVPKSLNAETLSTSGIPSTYVPARNTVFLSLALSYSEAQNINEIHFGANQDDFHPYPDCRPKYFDAFQNMVNFATRQSVEISPTQIFTPLVHMTKGDVIALGHKLKIPFHLTLSCYDPTPLGKHCMECLACHTRDKGFKESGVRVEL
jgi:7-cyano-7-deazaguanine synthase